MLHCNNERSNPPAPAHMRIGSGMAPRGVRPHLGGDRDCAAAGASYERRSRMTAKRTFGAPHVETLRVHAGESRDAVASAKGPRSGAQATLPGAALGLIERAARRALAALA